MLLSSTKPEISDHAGILSMPISFFTSTTLPVSSGVDIPDHTSPPDVCLSRALYSWFIFNILQTSAELPQNVTVQNEASPPSSGFAYAKPEATRNLSPELVDTVLSCSLQRMTTWNFLSEAADASSRA